jgi:actin-related protein
MADDDMHWYAEEFQTVVIDNGSTTVRAGFAGDDAPVAVFPSVVGRPKDPNAFVGMAIKNAYCDDEISQSTRTKLIERNPVQAGIVTNWDDMEKLWHYTFYNGLRVAPEEHPVYLTEVALNPKKHREKTTEIMFETFDVPCLFLGPAGDASLYSYGRTTGVVLSSGGGVTQAIPVYETHPLQHGITQLDIGGKDVTEHLIKLIDDSHNISFTTKSEREEINYIKTKCTYVAQDYEAELQNTDTSQKYDVFDGHITLRKERFQAPEILFKPQLFGRETAGVHEMIFNSVMKSDESIRQQLLNNIVLEGGNTVFPGFSERLLRELRAIVPEKYDVHVVNAPNPKNAAWLGASIVGKYGIFLRWCISKQNYDECGPRQVNWTCF